MARYRNGTYVAFHARGSTDPTDSDIKYYRLLKAWHVRDDSDFYFIDSHEKTAAVRDSSTHETLQRRLKERLGNSKNMILIVTKDTQLDADWVPFEIEYAIDTCGIPIIAAYPGYDWIFDPAKLRNLWPQALAGRIDNKSARVIHVPFTQVVLSNAVGQFDCNNQPKGALSYYSEEAYRNWGIIK